MANAENRKQNIHSSGVRKEGLGLFDNSDLGLRSRYGLKKPRAAVQQSAVTSTFDGNNLVAMADNLRSQVDNIRVKSDDLRSKSDSEILAEKEKRKKAKRSKRNTVRQRAEQEEIFDLSEDLVVESFEPIQNDTAPLVIGRKSQASSVSSVRLPLQTATPHASTHGSAARSEQDTDLDFTMDDELFDVMKRAVDADAQEKQGAEIATAQNVTQNIGLDIEEEDTDLDDEEYAEHDDNVAPNSIRIGRSQEQQIPFAKNNLQSELGEFSPLEYKNNAEHKASALHRTLSDVLPADVQANMQINVSEQTDNVEQIETTAPVTEKRRSPLTSEGLSVPNISTNTTSLHGSPENMKGAQEAGQTQKASISMFTAVEPMESEEKKVVDIFGTSASAVKPTEEDSGSVFGKAFSSEEDGTEPLAVVSPISKSPERIAEDTPSKYFEEDKEFMSKVDEAWFDKGSKNASRLIITFSGLLVFFVVWAAFASIDEVARGQGQIIPSQRTQIIQHLEGGILSDILVSEGETVEPGQILARVENIGAESLLRDTETQINEATLALIRLEAELNNEDPVFPEQYSITVPHLVAAQLQTYRSRRLEQEGARGIMEQQVEQKQQSYNEAMSRKQTYEQALGLVQKRIDLARPLVSRRLYPEVDYLNLQQEIVRIKGDLSAVENSIAKFGAELGEATQRINLARREFESSIVLEINELRAKLATLKETQTAGSDQVTRTALRSQVRGVVNRILLNTKGGVVRPGEDIMEIVPIDDSLVVETKVRPQDIAFIHPEQKAVVRITAYDSSIYGSMDAKVEQIGADTVTNEKGDIFFLVKVRTRDNAIYHKGETLPITPGMVASVDILTGKKTVLSYLLKPITKASQYALKER